jgi:hypothetical protein
MRINIHFLLCPAFGNSLDTREPDNADILLTSLSNFVIHCTEECQTYKLKMWVALVFSWCCCYLSELIERKP